MSKFVRRLSRRHFLQAAGTVVGSTWLVGCAPTQS
ncbi:MAG: twin-arginine translocation signal domain-containing protein, partial [Chloroflexi bacterium]|nr:twin-arginine translocation signal domain-containing protein [Chloroflexota bacterium]